MKRYVCAVAILSVTALFGSGMAAALAPGFTLELDRVARDDGDHIMVDTGLIDPPLTLELWMRPTSDEILGVAAAPEGEGHMHFYRHSEGHFYVFNQGQDERFALTGTPQVTGEWHHVALVLSTTGRQLYINGALDAQDSLAAQPHRIVSVGVRDDGDYNWIGGISEIRVWNTARSQAEIQQNMTTPLTGDESGLVGYWPLNEGSGTVATDLSPSGNDGTIVGGQWNFEFPFLSDLDPSRIVSVGQSVTLGPVELFGAEGAAEYQWHLNGEPIDGATGMEYTIASVSVDDAGAYHVTADDERDVTPVTSNTLELQVWENLPVGGAAALLTLGGALMAAGAIGLRRRR